MQQRAPDERLRAALQPDEQVDQLATAVDALVAVTDRRLLVVADWGVTLDVPFQALRRLQFDIERSRPATLVVVPESPSDLPQVLVVSQEHYRDVAAALSLVGERL